MIDCWSIDSPFGCKVSSCVTGSVFQNDEGDKTGVQHDLAYLAEIDGDLAADIGLHLPVAPFGAIRVADDHAGGQDAVQVGHRQLSGRCGVKGRDDLTALVGSRICHDLISPLGAIGNGVELMGLSGMAQTPEMALIAESVANANARIRFFRVAYGGADPGQMIARAEITGTLTAAARGGRLSYCWETDGDQPRQEVKAIFLLLQCFETAMPYGGDVRVRRISTGWEVEADGERLRIDEALWNGLVSPRARPAVSAAHVQFALLPTALAEIGKSLALKLGPDRILARF